jgi:hypothetical protein
MHKSVLSLSVAAALAVPGFALAQAAAPAAPAIPTLDKIFEASGISVSGYIDAAYTHANRDIEGVNAGSFSPRVFDSLNNSFSLQQFGLQVAKQPKSGFGGLVNITAGKAGQTIHSFPEFAGPTSSQFDLTQAYAQWADGPLTVIAGKFTTLHGTEVIWSPNNANFSRSLLFGAVPFTHTGVRATYAVSDELNLIAGLNNGWDQVQDINRDKTLELGVTFAPLKTLSLAASYYGGKEPGGVPNTTGGTFTNPSINGRRDSFNFTGSWTVIEPMTLGFEYLQVSQKDAILDPSTGGTKKASYSGWAAYLGYQFMPKLKATLRLEQLDDKDGAHFPVAVANAIANGATGVTGTKSTEYTLTLAYMAADNFELRGEVRQDKNDQAVFLDGTNFSKSLTTFAVQALYKF